ncbi:MAG: hypothetical protein CFE45_36725 [Burkholderiales bacterium PBB5]|nr:MAG: hypothetical protein CFE45_36725 [Burkholderiales bacterium PBB5]
MRGEATQVFGALALQQRRDATLLLPGTHSKWVTVAAGRITGLATHMTGEAYALLRQHSILARTLPADEPPLDAAAFEAGVLQARQPGGLLHHLFAVRTLALFERASPAQNASRLSGLLIGEELRARHAQAGLPTDQPVLLVGGAALAQRYAQALALWQVPSQVVDEQASWHGLAALAGTLRG